MHCLKAAVLGGIFAVAFVTNAIAWSAANCRAACQKTATTSDAIARCVAKWNCDHYTGAHSSDAKVDTYSKKWNAEHMH